MPADSDSRLTTRIAPSPTGEMHAGTIFAALQSWLIARSTGGSVVLRIEDLDRGRSRQEYAERMMEDLESLGITWDRGPYYQKDRDGVYLRAFEELASKSTVYPCFCTRADLRAMSAPHEGEEPVYDGPCFALTDMERTLRREALARQGRSESWRIKCPAAEVSFEDLYQGGCTYELDRDCGDFVIRRSDGGFAYQLAVVVDDHSQGIDCVSRGYDLLSSTPKQLYLYDLLGYDAPSFAHFPLFSSADGRRLAKRDRSASYSELLNEYGTPEGVLGHIAFKGGLIDSDIPSRPEDVLGSFSMKRMRQRYKGERSILFE